VIKGTDQKVGRAFSQLALRALALAAAFALLHCPAYGRIGETLEECERRYGPAFDVNAGTRPPGVSDGWAFFVKSGFKIAVTLFSGRVDCISFGKAHKNALGVADPLSDDEVQLLLNDNGGGRTWSSARRTAHGVEWTTADGALHADYAFSDHVLIIVTDGYVQRFRKDEADQAARRLEGF
jgi:hypothetical protein